METNALRGTKFKDWSNNIFDEDIFLFAIKNSLLLITQW